MELNISRCLKGKRFFMMPSVPYDLVFKRQSMMNDCLIEDKLYRVPFSLFRRSFFPEVLKVDKKNDDNAKILFYISLTKRPASKVNFNKAVSTISPADVIIEEYCKGRFSFHGFFLFFILQPIWFLSMFQLGLSLIEKCQVVKELTDLYHSLHVFKKIDIKKYNLLVTFNDSLVKECVLTLLFKQKGIKTATLQHGQFNAWRENTIANCGLEFATSNSDYQLCWNKYAQEEAMKAGWPIERLPVVGIISNIGRGKVQPPKVRNRIFGVVICHPFWQDENVMMIKCANKLADKIHYKYFVKLHPSFHEKDFDAYIDKSLCAGILCPPLDTLDYINQVEFSIVGSSSVFAELVYFYHDVIRYSSGNASDKYKPVKYGHVFTSDTDLIQAFYALDKKNEYKDKLFEYLCVSYDTGLRYNSFFSQFN